jgi:hypothetical protein
MYACTYEYMNIQYHICNESSLSENEEDTMEQSAWETGKTLDPILRQLNPAHILFTSESFQSFIYMHFLCLHLWYMSDSPHPAWFDHRNNV